MTKKTAVFNKVNETFPDMDIDRKIHIISVLTENDKETLVQLQDLIGVVNEIEV